MPKLFKRLNDLSRSEKIGILLILALALTTPFFGGWDFKEAYRADTLLGLYGRYTFNPYPAYWFFSIFAYLPLPYAYLLWNFSGALLLIAALLYLKNDILRFAVTLPCFWVFYGGQVEPFAAGGILLTLFPNPFLAGLGVFLLTIKPQTGFFPILFLLFNRRDWRIWILPAGIYLLSFTYWGWWIPAWLSSLSGASASHLWGRGVTLYPYGIILLPLLWRYPRSLKIWLLIQSLVMPYFSVYSLLIVFLLEAPAYWFSFGMWAFYLFARAFPHLFYPEFIFPLWLLASAIWKEEQARLRQKNPTQSTLP